MVAARRAAVCFLLLEVIVAIWAGHVCAEQTTVMSTAEALELPQPDADFRIAYGPDPLSFGELRLPAGAGPHPVAVLVHGGCWLAAYDLGYFAGLAEALADAGVATWSIEYRRVGDDGGGWPGTFADVAAAADHLHEISSGHNLDLSRVVAVGHSAGGHLALWLAARHGLPDDDELRGPKPLPVLGVVALAGIPDLESYASPEGCGAAVEGLLGGEPADVPERLLRASPAAMLPLGAPLVLVTASEDTIVPTPMVQSFAAAAREQGDTVSVIEVEGAGHFELSTPGSVAWPVVYGAVSGLVHPH